MRDDNAAPPEFTILRPPRFINEYIGWMKLPQPQPSSFGGKGHHDAVDCKCRDRAQSQPNDFEWIKVPTHNRTLGTWLRMLDDITGDDCSDDDSDLERIAIVARFRHALLMFPTIEELESRDDPFWPYQDQAQQQAKEVGANQDSRAGDLSPSATIVVDRDWETMSAPSDCEGNGQDASSEAEGVEQRTVDEPLADLGAENEHEAPETENEVADEAEQSQHDDPGVHQPADEDADETVAVEMATKDETDELWRRFDALYANHADLSNQVQRLLASAMPSTPTSPSPGHALDVNARAAHRANVISSHLGQPPMFPVLPSSSEGDGTERMTGGCRRTVTEHGTRLMLERPRRPHPAADYHAALERVTSGLVALEDKFDSMKGQCEACCSDPEKLSKAIEEGHEHLVSQVITPLGERLATLERLCTDFDHRLHCQHEWHEKKVQQHERQLSALDKQVAHLMMNDAQMHELRSTNATIKEDLEKLTTKMERLDAKIDRDEIKIDSLVSQFWRQNETLNKAVAQLEAHLANEKPPCSTEPEQAAQGSDADGNQDQSFEASTRDRLDALTATSNNLVESVTNLVEDSKRNFADLEKGHEANRVAIAYCDKVVQNWRMAFNVT
ncbi:hypothetical protein I317_00331 [Kwoniella heveanensis CBS 569]|nr:hypothetical protein I317_00331 [Kwoniella heveanensis CBS 569]